MPIPDYETIMLPLLKAMSDGRVYTMRDLIESLSAEFQLTDPERRELLPSGQQPIFDNRVGWAKTYLKKAGLIESDKRGTARITQRGLAAIERAPGRIDADYLEQFPEFIAFRSQRNEEAVAPHSEPISRTPEEILEDTYLSIQTTLAQELLDRIKSSSPVFFEKLVVDLIVAMGYGGSRQDAGKAVGRSGDGGIDGIIKEDRLGLDTIYIQAKKWEASVPIKEVRDFAGALLAEKARKGIFITTSQFSQSAYEYVRTIEPKIILIDGRTFTNLMIELGVGTAAQKAYKISRIDTDYFEE